MSKEILIFSPPFQGHLNILKDFQNKYRDQYEMQFVITGWDNIRPNLDGVEVPVHVLTAGNLHETDPALWTLPRVTELMDQSLALTEAIKPDLILYDFFSLEGREVGKKLEIPAWSSIPALMGSNSDRDYLHQKLSHPRNVQAFKDIYNRYGITIERNEIERISDGIHLPGEHNLVWTYYEISPPEFMEGRNKANPYSLVGHLRGEREVAKEKSDTTPTIYLSFGTVVMDNLWNNQPKIQENMRNYIGSLAELWQDKKLTVVFVTQGKKVLDAYPKNWQVYDQVDQVSQLANSDIFITHGGNNSFQEAVVKRVPLVVIPFFGDQPRVAKRAEELGIGINLRPAAEIDTRADKDFLSSNLALQTARAVESILKERGPNRQYEGLTLHATSLHTLLKSQLYYTGAKQLLKEELPVPTQALVFDRGQLLFGSNDSRILFEERSGLHNRLHIFKMLPFSAYASNEDSLPGIVDSYNDSLRNAENYTTDMNSEMIAYKQVLEAYRVFLNGELDISTMCVRSLDFFSEIFGVKFLTNHFNPDVNGITAQEMSYVLQNRHRFKNKVTFYQENTTGWQAIDYEEVGKLITGSKEISLAVKDTVDSETLWKDGIFVASTNEIKLKAVTAVVSDLYAIQGVKPDIKMNEQLVGMEETVFEVSHRLLSLRKNLEEQKIPYGLIVSIGNGITQRNNKWEDVGIVMMIDAHGKTSIAVSEGIVFPDKYVEVARTRGFEEITVGSVIAEDFNIPEASTDPHTLLTSGKISRKTLLQEAVVRALKSLGNDS